MKEESMDEILSLMSKKNQANCQSCQRNPEPMAMLEQKVMQTIKKFNLIEKQDKLVLGVSGGPDSICMLNILYKIYQSCQRNPEPMATHDKKLPRKPGTDGTRWQVVCCAC